MIDSAVEEFLEAVAFRYSSSSLELHRYGLKKLVAFSQGKELSEFHQLEFARFHEWLSEQPLSQASLSTILRSTKQFFRWAYQAERVLFDIDTYDFPKENQAKAKRPPSPEVVRRILELPDQATPSGLRNRLALELLYVLGLRRTECVSLNLKDLNLERATVFICGKGDRERLLPLSFGLLKTVERYLKESRPAFAAKAGEEALLLGEKGERLSGGVLYNIVRAYGKALGLKLKPHHLRHACATHLIEAGMEFDYVQALLGHSCPESTQYYAQIDAYELSKEFLSVHPRGTISDD